MTVEQGALAFVAGILAAWVMDVLTTRRSR